MKVRSYRLCVWPMSLLLFRSGVCVAQTTDPSSREAARAIAYEGASAFEQEDFVVAQERLCRAHELLKAPSTGLWCARSMIKNGHWVEAANLLLESSRLEVSTGNVTVQEQAKADALVERQALLERIPRLTVTVHAPSGSLFKVSIDGKPLPKALIGVSHPINPGRHQVLGVLGSRRREQLVEASEGTASTVTLTFGSTAQGAPVADPVPTGALPPESSGALPWAFIGIGGAAALAGGIAGLTALSDKNRLDCPDVCPIERRAEVDQYNSLRSYSTVGLWGGTLLTGLGVALLIRSGTPKHPDQMTLVLNGSFAGVRGCF